MISPEVVQVLWWSQPSAARPWWAWALIPLSWAYRWAFALDRAFRQPRRASTEGQARVPTVVVGNWVVGGAGKTPTTLALLTHLRQAGWTPGVVSRGYGRREDRIRLVDPLQDSAADVGDEPLLLARAAGLPVAVGRDRVAARRFLLSRHPEINVVVADDGLQHHRLHRDLSVVVVDERGAGNGQCLPAGPLREPIPSRLGAAMLVVYSGGRASLPLPGHVAQRRLSGIQSLGDWAAGHPLPEQGGWSVLAGRAVHAAAGIAVPQRFFDLLKQQGLELQATYPLPDHDDWRHLPWPPGTGNVVVTEKDAVKLARHIELSTNASMPTRIWVARLDLALPSDFLAAVDRLLPPPSTGPLAP